MTNGVRRTTFRERYGSLLHYLRAQISSGEWRPGDYIPTENELARTFLLSRPSVRKALNELAEEGLVMTMHGKGTIVSEPEEAIVLKLFWGMPSFEYEAIRRMVEAFNKTSHRIKVELIQVPRETLGNAKRDGIFFGSIKPDLIGMANTLFMQWADDGPEKVLQPTRLNGGDFYETYTRAFSHGDQLWAAPVTFAPIILLYNKTMFDKMELAYPDDSWTWKELLDASLALTEYDGSQAERYGFSFSASVNRWPLFVLQNGGVFAENGRMLPDDPRTKEALQFAADLMYSYKVSPIFSTGHTRSGEELFFRQKVGMILTSYVFLEQFHSIEFDWDFVGFPGRVPEAGFGIATGIGISSGCTVPEAAHQFLEYVTSEAAQSSLKLQLCSIPARKSVAQSREHPHYPLEGRHYYLFERLTERAHTLKDLGLSYERLLELDKELGLVWSNVASIEEVYRTLREKWNV